MSRTSQIFDFMRTCPRLADLWSIGGQEQTEDSVILPNGSSSRYQYNEAVDVMDNYNADIVPYPSVYEDYQINCYKYFDSRDTTEPTSNINVMAYDDVASVCEWVEEQDNNQNYPDIGERVVSLECNPFVPQIRYVDAELGIIAYFITIRIRYVNPAKRKSIYHERESFAE